MSGRRISLQLLDRRDLEDTVLVLQGYIRRVHETIGRTTQPEWKVRRELDALSQQYAPKLGFLRDASIAQSVSETIANRNAAQWERFAEGQDA